MSDLLPSDIKADLLNRLHDAREYRDGIKACCPYHDERTPSFYVSYYEKAGGIIGKCFGCGKAVSLNGLLIYLRSTLRHVIDPTIQRHAPQRESESVYRLDETVGYAMDEYPFAQRGIAGNVVQRFGFRVDYYTPALVFPVYYQYAYRGWIKRLLDPEAPFKYKIETSLPVLDIVWGYEDAIDSESDTVYVTEGIIDAACLWSTGRAAIALLGKHPHKLKSLGLPSAKQWCLLPDNGDDKSLQSFLDTSRDLCAQIAFLPPEFKDVSDMITKVGYISL